MPSLPPLLTLASSLSVFLSLLLACWYSSYTYNSPDQVPTGLRKSSLCPSFWAQASPLNLFVHLFTLFSVSGPPTCSHRYAPKPHCSHHHHHSIFSFSSSFTCLLLTASNRLFHFVYTPQLYIVGIICLPSGAIVTALLPYTPTPPLSLR